MAELIQRAQTARLLDWERPEVRESLVEIARLDPPPVWRSVEQKGRTRRVSLEGAVSIGDAEFLAMPFLRQPQGRRGNDLLWLLAAFWLALLPLLAFLAWFLVWGVQSFAGSRGLVPLLVGAVALSGAAFVLVVRWSHSRRQARANPDVPARFPPGLLVRDNECWVVYPDACYCVPLEDLTRVVVESEQVGLAAQAQVQVRQSLEFEFRRAGEERRLLVHELIFSSDAPTPADADALSVVSKWFSTRVSTPGGAQ